LRAKPPSVAAAERGVPRVETNINVDLRLGQRTTVKVNALNQSADPHHLNTGFTRT
jgi:hypothetical protein